MKQAVKGEAQVSDRDIKQHAPDLIGKRHQIAGDLQTVHKLKPQFDQVMQQIADQTGVNVSSRIKDPKQIVRKTVQKRMEDRNYQLSDVNDLLGYRFTIIRPEEEERVKQALEQAGKQGAFVIIKQQERDKQDYHAYHFDIGFPIDGNKTIRAEVQIMDTSAEAQAALSHDAHFQYGDKPPQKDQEQLKQQVKVVNQLPPMKQKQIADTMINLHKQNDDDILPKDTGKKVIASIANT